VTGCKATSRASRTSIASTRRVKREKGPHRHPLRNAGIGEFAPLGLISEEHFDKIFDVNVKGLLFTVQKALPIFKDGGSSS